MPRHNQPPGWAVQEAKDELDSEEYSDQEILERARKIEMLEDLGLPPGASIYDMPLPHKPELTLGEATGEDLEEAVNFLRQKPQDADVQ